MRLRPYVSCLDFEAISRWITDERTHALWSARLIPYPLERESFDAALERLAVKNGDCPFVAVDDDRRAVGFFCYSVDSAANTGKLKFVMTDSQKRGQGLGRRMIKLAINYAFEITGVKSVGLSVFSVNERAKRCYLGAGFEEVSEAPAAFSFGGESWGRCSMEIGRGQKTEFINRSDMAALSNPGVVSRQIINPGNSSSRRITVTEVHLEPGASQPRHTHESSEQIWYALAGKGRLLLADGERAFEAGDAVRFADGEVHGLLNDGEEEFVYISVTSPPIDFSDAYGEKNKE